MFKPKYHPKQRDNFLKITWALVALLGLASLLGFAGRLHWALDLFSHFRVQYAQLALVGAGVCLWVRFNKSALGFIVVFLINYALVFPLYFGKPKAPPTKQPMRAMLMNLYAGNDDSEAVLNAVKKVNPDLLLLEEVTPEWAEKLAELDETYPYRIAEPRSDNFGIMLLSKYPLLEGVVVEIGNSGVPSIIVDVLTPAGTITLVGTHPLPPIGKEYASRRNSQLQELAAVVRNQKKPVLLMGDLNTSPWSPHFQRMLRDAQLHDSMKGYGFQPSWTSPIKFLKIPLDHLLYTDGIVVRDRMIGGKIGSDHRPVILDFNLR